MSQTHAVAAGRHGALVRLQQLLSLAMVLALLWATSRLVPAVGGGLSSVAAIGFLLLAGTLASELLEPFKVPHLTAYIAAGVVAGPYGLHLFDHLTVEEVSRTNGLALALIALAGGAELRLGELRQGFGSLAWQTLYQTLLVFVALSLVFAALSPLLPFLKILSRREIAGVALLWGVIAVTRSPSALLGVMSQTRAQGPVTRSTLATVMTSDVVVLVLLATTLSLTRPLVEPGAALSVTAFRELGRELLGSVSLGTTLGLLLTLYLRFVNRSLVLVLLLLGFGFTEVVRYLHFEPMLTFLVAGFIVQNLSQQGPKFLHGIEGVSSVVYVVFFAAAGAHLDVPILRALWPVALVLCGVRAGVTVLAHRAAMHHVDEHPAVRKWGWAGLISQAGVALGIGAIVERNLPAIGPGIRSLILATIAINEVVGPVLFKFSLDRAGESRSAAAPPDA